MFLFLLIGENNNFEELSDINKLLLDTTIKKNNGIAINENEEEEENTPNPTGYRKLEEDISEKNENKLAELMKERESVTISPPVENNNGTNINDLLKKVSGTKIETIIDDTDENISAKIKKFNLIGIPYQLIIGSKSDGNLYEFKEVDGETQKLKVEDIASQIIKAKQN